MVDSLGAPIADTLGGAGYGLLNRSQTISQAGGGLIQFIDKRQLLGGNNELVVGLSHDRSRTSFVSTSELGQLTPDRTVIGLGSIIDQPDGAITPVSLRSTTRYTGLFVAESLPLGSHLTVELGLRWNDAHIRLADQLGTSLNGSHAFRRLNPGVELVYRLSPQLKLHAGYAETNRAPTPAELSCADETAPCSLTNFFVGDPPLKQVVAKSWKLGVSGKMTGNWTVRWQFSAYRTVSHDDIQLVAAPTLGRAFFQNVGITRRQGIELEGNFTQGHWGVRAGYAFTDATFRTPLVLNSSDNPSADVQGQISVVPGDRIPGIPRHRVTLSLEYESTAFTLGGDMQAQSGQYLLGDEGNGEPPTKAFAVFNLHGSVRLMTGVHLFAEVSNLFNHRYATFGTFSPTSDVILVEAPNASDPRSLTPGAPRQWLAGIRARF